MLGSFSVPPRAAACESVMISKQGINQNNPNMGLLTRKESDIQGRVGIGLGRHLLHLAAVQGDAIIRHRLETPSSLMPLASSVVPDSLTHFTGATIAACTGTDGESSAAENQVPSVVFLCAGEPRTGDLGRGSLSALPGLPGPACSSRVQRRVAYWTSLSRSCPTKNPQISVFVSLHCGRKHSLHC